MKKGFTLIELLAVIVILAIIALIATPIVLDIIEDTKRSAQLRGVENYIKAAEMAVAKEMMYNAAFKANKCNITSEGNLDCGGISVEVAVSGEKPDGGELTFGSGSVTELMLKYKDDTIIREGGELKFDDSNSTVVYKTYANGDVVYFDVATGKSCTNYHEDNSVTGYNGINPTSNPTSNQTSCLKFYAFLDVEGSESVNLILDHNTTATVAWTNSSTSTNLGGPIDVINQLYEYTKDWKGTITPENYTMDQKTQTSGADYTIKYSEAPVGKTEAYKARLITAQEIAKITGADKEDTLKWDEKNPTSSGYFLDGSKGTDENWQTPVIGSDKEYKESEYYWLYDRTYSCVSFGCKVSDSSNFGYWTSSSQANFTFSAWLVHCDGSISTYDVDEIERIGLRPVITVLRSNLQ